MNVQNFVADKRGSGRTTRMLKEAVRLADLGRAVYVVMEYPEGGEATLLELVGDRLVGQIKVEGHLPDRFDWGSMRARGSHPNCIWLIDHRMVERDIQFQSMFEAMTRFDGPGSFIENKQEIEIKLDNPTRPGVRDWLNSCPSLVHRNKEMTTAFYYDSPNLDLHKSKMALRIRTESGKYIQCLKGSVSNEGGLSVRTEHEAAVSSLSNLWTELLPGELRGLVLNKVFEVIVTRDTYLLRLPDDTSIEVVLDKGYVRSGDEDDPIISLIDELEIELVEGPGTKVEIDHIQDLAMEIKRRFGMSESTISKAQRGYKLLEEVRK